MKIAVGSKNPVKIEATKLAFEKVWPTETIEVIGIDVASGVSAQPMSDEESIQGAKNRAQKALIETKADFGVGLEGGIQKYRDGYFDCGWIAVISKEGRVGLGSTVKAAVPKKMMDLIHQGKELGHAIDSVFNVNNAKQANGHFGLMTNNAITRTSGYKDGVIMALTAFIHPHLF